MTPPATPPARSYAFENAVFVLIVPASLVAIGWVWFGRLLFGAGGWYLLLFVFTVVPLLALVLAITFVLALTQRRLPAYGRLTGRQAWAHVVLWLALLAFGFFVVDFGDTEESAASVFTMAVGSNPDTIATSNAAALVSAVLAAAAWVWLLVELIVGNRQMTEWRRSLPPQWGPRPAAPPYPPTAPPPAPPWQ